MLLLIRCTLFLLSLSLSQCAVSKSCLSSAHETLYNIRSVVRDDTLREGQQPTSALLFVPRGKAVSSLSAALSIALSPPAGDGVLFLNLSDVLNLPGTVIDAALLPEADVLPGGTLTDRRLVELQKLVAEMSAMADLNEPGKRRVSVIVHDASELTFEGINRINLLNRLLDGRSLVTDVDFRASSRSSRKAFKSGELSILVVVPWDKEEERGGGGRTNDVNSGETNAMGGDKSGDGEKMMVTEEEEGESVLQHNEKTRPSANTVAVDYLTKTWMRASEARAAIKGEKENRPLNLDALLGRLRSNVIVLSESLRIVEDLGDVDRVGGGGGTEEEERKKLACRRSDLKAAAEALLTDELSYKGRGGGGGGGRRTKGNKGRSSSSSSFSNFGKNSSFFLTLTAVLLSTLLIAVALYCMCCSSSHSTAVVEKKRVTKKPSAVGGGESGGIVINESSTSAIGSKKIAPKEGVPNLSTHGRGVEVEDSLGATALLNQIEKSKNVITDSNLNAAVRRRAKSTSDRQRKS